jgi:hypothetical protein
LQNPKKDKVIRGEIYALLKLCAHEAQSKTDAGLSSQKKKGREFLPPKSVK